MNSDIPPPDALENLPPADQAELRRIIVHIEGAISECFEAGYSPGSIANVLLSATAKILGCLNEVGRQEAMRHIRQNFPLMVEAYAISNYKEDEPGNGR